MAKIPVTLYPGGVGSTNPAASAGSGRSTATPSMVNPGPAAARQQSPDRATNDAQRAARQQGAPTRALPFGNGNETPGVVFGAGTTVAVQHKLGRAFVGAMLYSPKGGYLAYEIVPNTDARLDAVQTQFKCQNAVTATAWIW